MSRILIIEDETIIRNALRRLLERNGYEVLEAESVEGAAQLEELEGTDLVLADLRLPGAPGTKAIGLIPDVPVLIMTSFASVRSAVDSMKQGAVDYIAKPFNHDELLLSVGRVLAERRLARQNQALKSDVARSYPVSGMVGRSRPMKEVFQRINKVAPTNATVLVVGESGTGKELVARAIHEKSQRSAAPLVVMNCAAIPPNLIESELFGHEKGAFTSAVNAQQGLIETADGGTLFLDEIGELTLEAQARLLRVLEDGEIRRVGAAHTKKVDIRLIAATHRDLHKMVSERTFREDLFFRLNVMEIQLPPLRERGKDIRELAEALLQRSCQRLHKPGIRLAEEAIDGMCGYDWPGNVRELEHAIERAVILCDSDLISRDLLVLNARRTRQLPDNGNTRADLSLEEYFRAFVETHQDEMTETQLAKRLGISRKALWERRQRLGIPRPKGR
jgi:DNA-binding NtrC family response regulator